MPVPVRPLALAAAVLILAAGLAASLPGRPGGAAAVLGGAGQALDPAWDYCAAAVARVEREEAIPPLLLAAISAVESGRRHPRTGEISAWPWAVMAEGKGRYLPSRQAAIAEVEALRARGVRNIDVGCMQINLMHHPRAFASLEDAFDPVRNADYAARFLVELQGKANNWLQAASHYHSQTPEFAELYRAKVVAAWPEESRQPVAAPRESRLAAAAPAPVVPGGPGRVITLRPAGRVVADAGGRDLSAYRASPIPLVGRPLPRLVTPTRFTR